MATGPAIRRHGYSQYEMDVGCDTKIGRKLVSTGMAELLR
jgi:hypothetical protein